VALLRAHRTCVYTRSMRRIIPQVEQQILTQILLGQPYAEIAEETGVAVSTIKKIRARNKALLQTNKDEIERWTADEAKGPLKRLYKLINKALDEADRGEREISIKDLVLLSNQMVLHGQIEAVGLNNSHFAKRQNNLDRLLAKLKK
jgi:hypothetical protein